MAVGVLKRGHSSVQKQPMQRSIISGSLRAALYFVLLRAVSCAVIHSKSSGTRGAELGSRATVSQALIQAATRGAVSPDTFLRASARLRAMPASADLLSPAAPWAIRPADFGADRTGIVDSSAAFAAAVAALCARNTSGHRDADGTYDLGGALLDLEGGDYLLSAPIRIPGNYSNFAFGHGTLRAAPGAFPAGAFLLDIGAIDCADVCTEALHAEDLFLDGSGVAGGGLRLSNVMGSTIGPALYVVNFTGAGIDIEGGHEVEVAHAWLGTCWFSDWECRRNPATLGNSTGILVNGNDHVLRDVVVWAAFTGVRLVGAANVVDALHTWCADGLTIPGSAGLVVEAQFNRVLAPYMDGTPLVLDCSPGRQGSGCLYTTVTGGFFLGEGAQVVLAPPLAGNAPAPVRGMTIRDNIFNAGAGNASVVVRLPGAAGVSAVVDVTVEGSTSWQGAVSTRATLAVAASAGPSWSADFSNLLLFNATTVPIRSVGVAAVCVSGSCATGYVPPPYALLPEGAAVRLLGCDADSTWALTVTVDQSARTAQ